MNDNTNNAIYEMASKLTREWLEREHKKGNFPGEMDVMTAFSTFRSRVILGNLVQKGEM